MADVFVSYAKRDRARVEPVVLALKNEGFSVWWDERLEASEHWDEGIERELGAAAVVLVLWTKASVQSRWVRTEAQFGVDHNKLVPATLEACTLPIAFTYVQAVDLITWRNEPDHANWRRLISRARDVLVGQRQQPAERGFDPTNAPDWRAGGEQHVNGEPILRGNTVTPRSPAGTFFRDHEAAPLMCVIPAGSFLMGSLKGDPDGRENEQPPRTVQVTRSFAVSTYLITFANWDRAAQNGGPRLKPHDGGWGRDQQPVINVSWHDAHEYAQWLSRQTGERYRLMSEAEWEYACRAGATTPYACGTTINASQATFGVKRATPVGGYEANAFGLFDVHGNVREWVQDLWHDNYADAPKDQLSWESGHNPMRVVRGGAWSDQAWMLRAASRSRASPDSRCSFIGIRLARDIA